MSAVVPYEQRLKANFLWALREGSMHFGQGGGVQETLTRIAQRLEQLGIPYAIVGGMALFYHGYKRFTEDVDLLVTRAALREIHEKLEGLGYLPPFEGSKNLRDTETGVRIEFLISGDYPGDGQPKPVVFPDPATVAVEIAGLRFLSLPKLIDLKLASGMSNPRRAKDLVDVQELIATVNLGDDVAEQLDPSVREKFLELLRVVRDNPQPPE